ncbi:MAG TPA: HEPN domain-containing protein [Thermoguttaceae bacterium]
MLNQTVKEWIAKGKGDFYVACRERRARTLPNWDAVCFHCQQCVEKFFKALLIHHNIMPPKTHDLVLLDGLLSPVCREWSWPLEELRFLTRAAVAFRYPGESAEKEEAVEALKITRKIHVKLLAIIKHLDPNLSEG